MNGYHKYTPLRRVVPFILGIAFALNCRIEVHAFHIIRIALLCIAGLIISYLFFRTKYELRWIPGLMAYSALFILGVSMVLVIDQRGGLHEGTGDSSGITAYLCRIEMTPA